MKSWSLAFLVALCLFSGCICTRNPFSKGEGNESGTVGGDSNSQGLLGSLTGGGKADSTTPDHCKVPAEAAGLKISDCDKIKNPFEKATCVGAVALSKDDADTCDNLEEELLRAACVSLIAECDKDESLCTRLGEKDVGNEYACIGGVAEAKRDVSLCDSIDNPAYKNPCIAGVAAAKKDATLCDRLEDRTDKNSCIEDVAVALKDASICQKIEIVSIAWDRDECINKVAIATGDMSLCERLPYDISNRERKQKCVSTVAANKTDPSVCGVLSDIDLRETYCMNVIASATGDLSVCDKVTDKVKKRYCISRVAVAKKDVTICQKIPIKDGIMTLPSTLNECVTEIAKATKDKAACDKAYDKQAKADCLRQVA